MGNRKNNLELKLLAVLFFGTIALIIYGVVTANIKWDREEKRCQEAGYYWAKTHECIPVKVETP